MENGNVIPDTDNVHSLLVFAARRTNAALSKMETDKAAADAAYEARQDAIDKLADITGRDVAALQLDVDDIARDLWDNDLRDDEVRIPNL